MQRIKLLKSQKIALQMKSEKVQQAIILVQARQKEVNDILKMIMTEEHYIPKEETNQWKLSKDEQAIEKIEAPKDKKEKHE